MPGTLSFTMLLAVCPTSGSDGSGVDAKAAESSNRSCVESKNLQSEEN